MAVKQGDRYRVTVQGIDYWYNPETGRWFDRADAKWNQSIPAPAGGVEKIQTLGLTGGRDVTAPPNTSPTVVGEDGTRAPGEPLIPGEGPGEVSPPGGDVPIDAPPGWTKDEDGNWVPIEAPPDPVDERNKESLRGYMADILSQYGLDTPGLRQFVERAITEGWDSTRIMNELRKHPDYLANPLFVANIERTKQGRRFMAEGEVLAWADRARQLAKQYGYQEPSNNYLASGLLSGLSAAEIEHRFQISQQVNQYGAGVKWVMEQEYGLNLSDQDLFEIFDPETDTQEWSVMFRRAQLRGRPFALGLGVRTEAEAQRLEMLGVDTQEAFRRYEGVAQNATRFERLGAIESMVTKNLPANFGDFSSADNSILVRALVFQDPAALAELQAMTAREVARFSVGGGAAATQQGQLVGLLAPGQR